MTLTILLFLLGLMAVIATALTILTIAFLFNSPMPKWFREWSCSIGLHSFKQIATFDYAAFYPRAKCQWCSDDVTEQYGNPPEKFVQHREKVLSERSSY